MYLLTCLEHTETYGIYGAHEEDILIELYINYKTNKKYILNKIRWQDVAYVKEYYSDTLTLTKEDIFIMPYSDDDEEIYGKNPLSIGSWRIESERYRENYLTETDIYYYYLK